MTLVLGLDPGMDGAAAAMTGDPETLARWLEDPGGRYGPLLFRDYTIPAPTRGRQYDHGRLARDLTTLAGKERVLAVLEQPSAARRADGAGMSRSGSLAIGIGFGLLLGIIGTNGWEVVIVQPSTWHRALFGKNAAGEPKARALAYVRDRIPIVDPTLEGRFKKPHQGYVDALCLASYGMRFSAEKR